MTTKRIWKSVALDESWLQCNTGLLDIILPSWLSHREEIKNSGLAFVDFIEKQKRKHAIETGIVENLYFVEDNLTKSLILDGFLYDAVDPGAIRNTNKKVFFQTIDDQLKAVNYVYEYILSGNQLTIAFVRSLHALVAAHQKHYEAVDSTGQTVFKELRLGEFKTLPNNPAKVVDGEEVIFQYCAPELVQAEITQMVDTYNENLLEKPVSPAIKAAWLHHAFTSIHPFPDGNGRVARLLASYSLIKDKLFPFSVAPSGKQAYFEALELADEEQPQKIVSIFVNQQREAIKDVLREDFTIKGVSPRSAAELLRQKTMVVGQKQAEQRRVFINNARSAVFDKLKVTIENTLADISTTLSEIGISVQTKHSDDHESGHYYEQIVACAKHHDYFFRKDLGRKWSGVSLRQNSIDYYLVISLHHFGRPDSSLAINSFISEKNRIENQKQDTPVDVEPVFFSIEENFKLEQISNVMQQYVNDVLTYHISYISSQIG